MNDWDFLAFLVFPYISLTIFVLGHLYRHFTDPYRWNAKSSELLDRGSLKYSSVLFHYGMVFTVLGHAGGMLIPQSLYDGVGISGEVHTRLAVLAGAVIGAAAVTGNFLLLRRRVTNKRILVNSTAGDLITLSLLLLIGGIGTYNVFFGHYYVLDTVAPWIRSIVTFSPDHTLMRDVPFLYKLHIVAAFALFAFSPFSRLIHIWSLPLPYFLRNYIVFRRRSEGDLQ
ncbi:MAG: respiratory nitrate reductase subunit gamma [Syntrophobacteraceae bacterium]